MFSSDPPRVNRVASLLHFIDGPTAGLCLPPVPGWAPPVIHSRVELPAPNRWAELLYVRGDDGSYRVDGPARVVEFYSEWCEGT
jgi:hypothetical protein